MNQAIGQGDFDAVGLFEVGEDGVPFLGFAKIKGDEQNRLVLKNFLVGSHAIGLLHAAAHAKGHVGDAGENLVLVQRLDDAPGSGDADFVDEVEQAERGKAGVVCSRR